MYHLPRAYTLLGDTWDIYLCHDKSEKWCKYNNFNSVAQMKVIEMLKIGRIFLETLQESCIKINDVRYVGMYEEYLRIMEETNKTSYAAAVLSEKYGISERQFFYIIKRFGQDCKIHAV